MGVTLYNHNQSAYDAAVSMLAETGKAAVIHPTGTGKSFIGFKLAEQHHDARVCWLSPSEYIFKTQLENLKATGCSEPENVTFLTYAKLMMSDDTYIKGINPDYIILDEFHRCGAAEWGKGVERLLVAYPNTKILGLSATHIRYLDNQRNMADELFDGNIASEMTLGEAIVRDILLPPVYITSIYSYQKDLEKYRRKVQTTKNPVVRDAAQKLLDTLRRALENAEGLDVIFDKHIKNRNGKYIIFCANIEHMREMKEKMREWFAKIDKNPHVYCVYAENSQSEKEFAAFKDDDSEHAKLLFTVNALNEGIHVLVDGIMLLRPTVSPIIYKQQIGRALSASKCKDSIIFDIVNNFENLYSVAGVEQEMREVVNYYNRTGNGGNIINERFQVIDEVRDCKRIFDELNDTLTTSWETMLESARYYKEKFGNLLPARSYKDGQLALGEWIRIQRGIKSGTISGIMTADREQKLTELGMVWEEVPEIDFERNYRHAQAYFEENGVLDADCDYVNSEGFPLGLWLRQLRCARRGTLRYELTDTQAKLLDNLNMVWNLSIHSSARYFEQGYAALLEYKEEHGQIACIPHHYKTNSNFKLGVWIAYTRRKYKAGRLDSEQIAKLNDLGFIWENGFASRTEWEAMYEKACEYRQQYGSLNAVYSYRTPDNTALGSWIHRQRAQEKAGKLSSEYKSKLDAIQMIWDVKQDAWLSKYNAALEYFNTYGSISDVPKQLVTEDKVCLGEWVYNQRQIYHGRVNGESLEDWQIEKLDAIGMRWTDYNDELFNEYLTAAKAFFEENGHLRPSASFIGSNGKLLYNWLAYQRTRYKNGTITEEQKDSLSALSMKWDTGNPWEKKYCRLVDFIKSTGNPDDIPNSCLSPEGLELKKWLQRQRLIFNGTVKRGILTEEQAKRLMDLGIRLSAYDPWDENFKKAAAYYKVHGDINNISRAENKELLVWLGFQRMAYREGRLTAERISKLEGLKICWLSIPEQQWNKHCEELSRYMKKHGKEPPAAYRNPEDGFALGMWVYTQRRKMVDGKLSEAQLDTLAQIGVPGFKRGISTTSGYHEGRTEPMVAGAYYE